MPIKISDYPEKVDTGIKADATFTRFLLMINFEGKRKRKTIDYSRKSWVKKDRIKNIKIELEKFRDLIEKKASGDITLDTKLDEVAALWFTLSRNNTNWTTELRNGYDLYVKPDLGNIALGRITQTRVDMLRKKMEGGSISDSKQTVNGCSGRTIKKILNQTLLPILRYGIANGADVRIPTIRAVPIADKKEVVNPVGKFKSLYTAILTRYADIPFYRGMFLLALYGRRWNEIATLETGDVDFLANTYTIRATNSKTKKEITYDLPPVVAGALLELDADTGLIFKSPVTGKKPWSPKKQLQHLKSDTGIEELTMHYFRHIVSSALADVGSSMELAADMLGHSNTKITAAHYVTKNKLKSSSKANKLLDEVIKK